MPFCNATPFGAVRDPASPSARPAQLLGSGRLHAARLTRIPLPHACRFNALNPCSGGLQFTQRYHTTVLVGRQVVLRLVVSAYPRCPCHLNLATPAPGAHEEQQRQRASSGHRELCHQPATGRKVRHSQPLNVRSRKLAGLDQCRDRLGTCRQIHHVHKARPGDVGRILGWLNRHDPKPGQWLTRLGRVRRRAARQRRERRHSGQGQRSCFH